MNISKKEFSRRVSEGMKKCHADGKHPGWSHVNNDKNRRSYPEKFFRKVLNNNSLFDKYTIYENMPFGKYFLDFAIIDLKLNIEIDGQQHFRTQKAIDHDKIRNKYLIENGWKVYRISWLELNNDTKKTIVDFLNYLNTIHENTSRFYSVSEVKLKYLIYCKSCGIELKYKNKSSLCRTCYGKSVRKAERPSRDDLLKMIEETSYSAVGRKYGVSDNAIRKWLK